MIKENYEQAKMNGKEELYRGDNISNQIGQEIPFSEQMSIARKQIYAIAVAIEKLSGDPVLTDNFKRWYEAAESAIDSVDKTIQTFEEAE